MKRLITMKMDEWLALWSQTHAQRVGCSRTALITELLGALREGRLTIAPKAGAPIVNPPPPQPATHSVPPPPTKGPTSKMPQTISVKEFETYLEGQQYLFFRHSDAQALAQRIEKRFTDRTQHGCWVQPGKATQYPNITLRGKPHKVHRVSYAIFVEPLPPWFFVCHLCDNPRCVNPSHLRLGSPGDNKQDQIRKTGSCAISVTPTDPTSWDWPPTKSMAFPAQGKQGGLLKELAAMKALFPKAFEQPKPHRQEEEETTSCK